MPLLEDRRRRPVVTHRIACGRPGKPPVKLDYLEITYNQTDRGDAYVLDAAAMERLATLGPQYTRLVDVEVQEPGGVSKRVKQNRPRRIPIRLFDDDLDVVVDQEYRARAPMPVKKPNGEPMMDGDKPVTRTGVFCHGNGKEAHRLTAGGGEKTIRCCASPSFEPRTDAELAQILGRRAVHNPEDGKRCPFAQNGNPKAGPKCVPETTLFVLSDVVSNIGGVCRIRTHAHSSADTLVRSLQDIKARMPGGLLRNVPLDLVLEMKQLPQPGTGKLQNQPILHIELALPYEKAVQLIEAGLQSEMRALGTVKESRKLLASARDEEAGRDVDDEWPVTDRGPPAAIEHETPSGGLAAVAVPTPPAQVLTPDQVLPPTKPPPAQPALLDPGYDPGVDGDR